MMNSASILIVTFLCINLILLNSTKNLIQANKFTILGVCLIAWPEVCTILVFRLHIALNEFAYVALRYIPCLVYAINLMLSTNKKKFFGLRIMIVVPSLISLVFGFIEGQTILYPIAWVAIVFPLLFDYSLSITSANIYRIGNISTVILAISILIVVSINPDTVFAKCRVDKCNVFGSMLAPSGVQSNVLSLAFGLMIALTNRNNSFMWKVNNSLSLLLLAEMCGGRSGFYAGTACFIYLMITSIRSRRQRFWRNSLLAISTVVSLIPLFVNFEETSFTGRANLWLYAKNLFSSSPLIGYGPSFWIRMPATNLVQANYSPHNVWWELLISTGIVGTLSTVAAILYSLVTMNHDLQEIAIGLLVGILIAGFSEAMVMPYRLIIVPGFYILLVAITGCRSHNIRTESLN